MTGVYTGRSPKDKYIVKDDVTEETVWWNTPEYPNDNKPITPETWEELEKTSCQKNFQAKTFTSLMPSAEPTNILV